jgi:hypothetical protein
MQATTMYIHLHDANNIMMDVALMRWSAVVGGRRGYDDSAEGEEANARGDKRAPTDISSLPSKKMM